MLTFKQLIEKAKVVGHITLPQAKSTKKQTGDYISKKDLDSLEKILDQLFANLKIDIEFSRHFLDRVNDARNRKQITIPELNKLFRTAHQKHGNKLAGMEGMQAVLTDIQTKINIPFVLKQNDGGELELMSKTVMRKHNFKTSNKKYTV